MTATKANHAGYKRCKVPRNNRPGVKTSTAVLQQTTMVLWPGKSSAAACLTLQILFYKLAGHKLLLLPADTLPAT